MITYLIRGLGMCMCYVHWNNRSSCAICERDAEEEAMVTTSPDESSRYSSSAEGDGFISSMNDKVVREQVTTPSPTIKEDDPFSTTSSLLDNLPIETGALCKFSVLLSNSVYFKFKLYFISIMQQLITAVQPLYRYCCRRRLITKMDSPHYNNRMEIMYQRMTTGIVKLMLLLFIKITNKEQTILCLFQ